MNECKIIQLVPCVRGFDLHLCKHTPIRTHTHTHTNVVYHIEPNPRSNLCKQSLSSLMNLSISINVSFPRGFGLNPHLGK